MAVVENMLTSGFTFTKEESLLRFKFKMFNIMLLISMGAMLAFALLHDLGFNELGAIHARTNYFAALVCLLAFFWLRQSKAGYRRVAIVTICAVMASFTSAVLYVPNDEFRMVWFLLAVIAAHLVVGRNFGLIIMALSVLIVLGVTYLFELHFSGLTLTTFVVSIMISSLLLTAYNQKVDEYKAELLHQNAELKDLANRDALTGIMSRRYFLDMANHYFNGAVRNGGPISLIMLDIDYFKNINDTYGHHVGDHMLILFTTTIEGCLRKSDIFGRLGGEEFGIILFETDKAGSLALAEKLQQALECVHYEKEGQTIKMAASIGICEWAEQDSDFEKLMIRTDNELYKAKSAGRNRISVQG